MMAVQRMPGPARELLQALLQASSLEAVVPAVIAIVEHDPLASAGCFRGDLLRGLMNVPNRFWTPHAALYERYRASLRACALARRRLPDSERMEFWSALESPTPARCARLPHSPEERQ